ncbi:(2,3-dihydroxybenzoyl)adenylate synthase [Herbaspirillum autotrophicum]|uniref:(2,3-dihydroxybenzoyl)adenylate synthase n=1 Tax=Herbaspirillum autotrophicum TaxID=180195 RepID=UPI00067E006A|nr:(2,3-dihydroxybenzoyl)adenylate synthase [Herbaspirillum autotrophicum]
MSRTLLAGCVAWPAEFEERYRAIGYWSGETFGEMLHQRAQHSPTKLAVICGSRRWTYGELDQRADRFAAGLLKLGIRARDRVVLQLPNIAEFLVACFALFRIAAVPVFALVPHRRTEITYFCRFTGATAYLIADHDGGFDFRQLARQVCADVDTLQHVIVAGDAQEFVAFDSLYAEPCRIEGPASSDIAFLQLSGGSTGIPKLIPRTHDDYLYSVRASVQICGLGPDSIYLCVLPAAHNFALSSPGSIGTLYAGGRVVMTRLPSPDTTFPLIATERVTITSLVPPLALIWLDAARCCEQDLSSLQVLQVGGARFAEEAARRVGRLLGCTLQQVFGMAEGLVNYTRFDDPAQLICGTQGRPISPDDEIRIVDDEDRNVPPGQPGHLLTRGPYTIRGYYRAEAHNAVAFTSDGFYRTGDIVRMLPSGHLIVEGRSKDQINRGGEKVAAEEIENHLIAHPAIHDVALVAMPDADFGERSCAFVIVRQRPGVVDAGALAAELLQFLRERNIARFKLPDRIEFTDSFPKTGVGKVDKRALREQIARLVSAPHQL